MANNNYPQITSVTSESLQAQIRTLLPSQEGFGTDLMAQNVIVPVIDLTAAAEGSSVRQDLQSAFAFGSQTSFQVFNTTSTIINSTGFWRVFGGFSLESAAAGSRNASFNLADGLATKLLIGYTVENGQTGDQSLVPFDFVVFLAAGDSLTATTSSNQQSIQGSYRQIADINGALVNPSGFNPQ